VDGSPHGSTNRLSEKAPAGLRAFTDVERLPHRTPPHLPVDRRYLMLSVALTGGLIRDRNAANLKYEEPKLIFNVRWLR
jgi:hypothetical protein